MYDMRDLSLRVATSSSGLSESVVSFAMLPVVYTTLLSISITGPQQPIIGCRLGLNMDGNMGVHGTWYPVPCTRTLSVPYCLLPVVRLPI